MWDFFDIVIQQLSETFKWSFTGFLITITVLILLYKNNLLSNSGPISFVKKVSYYIFFPLYIGIITWFFAATFTVEKNALELTKITLAKAENSLFPEFYSFAISLADEYIGTDFPSKEELITQYLTKYDYKEDDYSTKAIKWSLNNGLSYIENQAIERGTISIGEEKINFPQLISNYLNGTEDLVENSFNYVRGMSVSTIKKFARSFYWIYFWMVMVVVCILCIDIYLTKRLRRKQLLNFINPETTLGNNQKKLDSNQHHLEGQKKLP